MKGSGGGGGGRQLKLEKKKKLLKLLVGGGIPTLEENCQTDMDQKGRLIIGM